MLFSEKVLNTFFIVTAKDSYLQFYIPDILQHGFLWTPRMSSNTFFGHISLVPFLSSLPFLQPHRKENAQEMEPKYHIMLSGFFSSLFWSASVLGWKDNVKCGFYEIHYVKKMKY